MLMGSPLGKPVGLGNMLSRLPIRLLKSMVTMGSGVEEGAGVETVLALSVTGVATRSAAAAAKAAIESDAWRGVRT